MYLFVGVRLVLDWLDLRVVSLGNSKTILVF